MLTEASGLLAERDYRTLRMYSGVAPVTKRSGKRLHAVHMQYACNLRLRKAAYHWGRTSIQHDPHARAYYDALRARGHQHARGLRILMALLKNRTLYNADHWSSVASVD